MSPLVKAALAAVALVVLAVSIYVLAGAWLYVSAGGGIDGPCSVTTGSVGEGGSIHMEETAFPLGYTCLTRDESGEDMVIESRSAKGASFLTLGLLAAAVVSVSAGFVGTFRDGRVRAP